MFCSKLTWEMGPLWGSGAERAERVGESPQSTEYCTEYGALAGRTCELPTSQPASQPDYDYLRTTTGDGSRLELVTRQVLLVSAE